LAKNHHVWKSILRPIFKASKSIRKHKKKYQPSSAQTAKRLENLIKYDFRQQFFEMTQPKMIKDIMANLEAVNSKLFFEIAQKVSGLKKQATIAKAF